MHGPAEPAGTRQAKTGLLNDVRSRQLTCSVPAPSVTATGSSLGLSASSTIGSARAEVGSTAATETTAMHAIVATRPLMPTGPARSVSPRRTRVPDGSASASM